MSKDTTTEDKRNESPRVSNLRNEIDALRAARDMFKLYRIPFDNERLEHVHNALTAARDEWTKAN
jgi:hypothetical protein